MVVGIVLFVLGVFASRFIPSYLGGSGGTYQAGFDAARQVFMNSRYGQIVAASDQQEVRQVSGTASAVDGNRITLHTVPVDPFADLALTDRTVLVAADTKIVKLTLKDPKVFQSELAVYTKATQTKPTAVPTPPDKFVRTAISLSDIVVGDSLTIVAIADIRTAKEFTASEVSVSPKP